MISDIDDMMTAAIDDVQDALRGSLADTFAKLLAHISETVGDTVNDSDGDSYASDVYGDDEDDDNNAVPLSEARENVADAWRAGRDAALAELASAVESGSYVGWRPVARS